MRRERRKVVSVSAWVWPCLGALAVLLSFVVEAGEKPVTSEELVRRLGDPDFRVRKLAADALVRLGHKALPALEAGMNDSNPEIRRRCRELYPQALSYDLDVKIKQFLAADDDKTDALLPGWRIFREIVGGEAVTKRFFADIYRCGHALLDKVERANRSDDSRWKREVLEEYARLCQGLRQQVSNRVPGQPEVIRPEEFALALLLSCILPGNQNVVGPDRQIHILLELTEYTSVRQLLREKTEKASIVRRLLAGVAMKTKDETCWQQTLLLALHIEFPEVVALARRQAQDKKLSGYLRGLALTVVAKHGGKQELAFLERFLADSSLVTMGHFRRQKEQIPFRTELRDLALALLVDLTGQRLWDYPFSRRLIPPESSRGVRPPTQEYHPEAWGFDTSEQREAAFKKWQQWRQNQPQP